MLRGEGRFLRAARQSVLLWGTWLRSREFGTRGESQMASGVGGEEWYRREEDKVFNVQRMATLKLSALLESL